MRPNEVAQIVGRLRAAFPSARTEDATALVWAEELAPIDLGVAMAATRRWIQEEEWFPTLAKFLELCRSEALAAQKRSLDRHPGPCHACGGASWIEESRGTGYSDEIVLTPSSSERWLPCQACNGPAYDRWRDGHYEPDHRCQDCDDLRKGRRPSEQSA